MNRQRSFLLVGMVCLLLVLSGWILYGQIQTARTTFMSGAPTAEIQSALVPKTVPLADLKPPAVRPEDEIRYGSPTSVASVIEFGDYECESCRALDPVIQRVLPTFKGTVRFVWRDLPVKDVNPDAFEAAMFARCAALQGKFWEAHDALLAAPSLDESTYASIASNLKLNAANLASCRADANGRAALQNDVDVARNDGINAAPLLFIGTAAHQGPMTADELIQRIKAFLAS